MQREKANQILDDTRIFLKIMKETKKQIRENLFFVIKEVFNPVFNDKVINLITDSSIEQIIPKILVFDLYFLQFKPFFCCLRHKNYTDNDFLNNDGLLNNDKWYLNENDYNWQKKRPQTDFIAEIEQLEDILKAVKEQFEKEKKEIFPKKTREQKNVIHTYFFKRQKKRLKKIYLTFLFFLKSLK